MRAISGATERSVVQSELTSEEDWALDGRCWHRASLS